MKLSEYNTSLSGMLAAQRALATAKQNISNLHTEGYVRQKANFQTVGPSQGSMVAPEAGYGVQVSSIERVSDALKTSQYNNQLAKSSYYDYKSTALSQAETAFSSSSLNELTDEFFTGWRELQKHPNQSVYYQPVLSAAAKWTSQMNRLSADLGTLSAQAETDMHGHIADFNRLTAQLAEANAKIGEAGLTPPNELLDERDRIIAGMAKYAPVEVSFESQNPAVATVRLNGILAVASDTAYPLMVKQSGTEAAFMIGNTEVKLDSGTIRAALDVRQVHVASYQQNLDTYAQALRDEINTIAREDYTARTGSAPAQNADGTYETDFFTGGSAGDLRVNAGFAKTLSLDAISKIAELMTKTVALPDGGSSSLSYQQFLDDTTVRVAADVNEATSAGSIHNELLESLGAAKMSVEGVNIDEEMVNLMMYQNYFAANSKAIQTMNQVYDSLFSIIS